VESDRTSGAVARDGSGPSPAGRPAELDGCRALLLDKSFRPLRAVGWRRALLLGLSGRVEVLEYYERRVRTPSSLFALPAVIRVPGWVDRMPQVVALTRRNVLLRDGNACMYCGTETGRELTIDHVVPRSRGGRTEWDNVVAACAPCNRRKGDRTPTEAEMRLRVAPRAPSALQLGRRGMIVVGDPPPEWRAWL
jgi:5-methylcytosine-specific restriction endonuclease McrA